MNECEMAIMKLNEKGPDICQQIKEIFELHNYMPPYIYDKSEDIYKNEDKMLFYVGKHLEFIGSGRKLLIPSSLSSFVIDKNTKAEEVLVLAMKQAVNYADYSTNGVKAWVKVRSEHFVKTGLFFPPLGFGIWPYPEFLLWETCYSFFMNTMKKMFSCMYLTEAFKSGLAMTVVALDGVYAIPFPKCHVDQNRNIHNESGPAIIWSTGEKSYYLNGVKVTQMIVETPAEQLDPHILLEERNAEVRREIVKKIGIERICHVLKAKVIDKQGDYELLVLHLGDGRKRPYLKMRNPSAGYYHIEGVRPNTKTVREALFWRNQTVENPSVLT